METVKKQLNWILHALLYFTLFVVANLFVGFIIGIVIGIIQGMSSPDSATLQSRIMNELQNPNWMLAMLLFSDIAAILFILVYYAIRKRYIEQMIPFNRISIQVGLVALLLGVAVNLFLVSSLSYAGDLPFLQQLFSDYEKSLFPFANGNLLFTIFAIGILIPIVEELIFRGLLTYELKKAMPITAAILIQAILFALFHFNWIQSSYAFLLGLLFGLVNLWMKSIWPSILLHIANNSTSVMAGTLPIDPKSLLLLSMSLILTILFVLFLWWMRRKVELLPFQEKGA